MSGAAGGWTAKRILYAVLGLQLAIAAFLAGSDVLSSLPRLAWPSGAPALDGPVNPGDQTRRYTPRDTPLPPRAPGAPERPYRNTGDMPTRIEFKRAGDILHLTGAIAPGDAARLRERLESEPGARTATLNSPGGSVREALAMGRILRDTGLGTTVDAGDVCFSACPYVLAAGTERRVAPDAQVGVHQHYFGKNAALPAFLAVSDIQRGQGDVMQYLGEMGVDPRLMRPALATPPDEIYVLVEEELRTWRVVTNDTED